MDVASRVALAVAVGALLCHCSRSSPQDARSSPSPRATPSPVEPDLERLNASAPGETLELASHLVPGKLTLFEFYSSRCEHSQAMQPVMEYLAARRGDLAIRQVDIDRPDAGEPDFDSPLAEQYAVEATPSFRLYDAVGTLVAEGTAAKDQVRQWYQDEQLGERAERLPGVSDRYRSPQD